MTPPLHRTAAENRRALVAQLYDQWQGYYMLRQLICGAWCDVRPLSREEAEQYRGKADEAIEIIWQQEANNGKTDERTNSR